jgi:hypothetical protein
MSKTQEWCVIFITANVIALIMRDEKISRLAACQKFYESPIGDKLADVETGLYTESHNYVYALYREAMTGRE